jgi:hypothetical protein
MALDSLSDCLNLMEEKLDEAVREPQSQARAIGKAAEAMPTIREIVEGDDVTKTFAALVCDEFLREESKPWWDEFAQLDREKFLERAYWLRRGISAFRSAVEMNQQLKPER